MGFLEEWYWIIYASYASLELLAFTFFTKVDFSSDLTYF